MSNDEHDRPDPSDPSPGPGPYSQDIRHTSVSARVPEKVGRGVFANATTILQTQDEFLIDFLSTMAAPQQVVVRVVLPAATFAQFVAALKANIATYEQHFGKLAPRQPLSPSAPPAHPPGAAATGAPAASPAPAAPAQPGQSAPAAQSPPHAPLSPPPDIAEFYGQLKFPDELLGGVFANVVMIRHTAEEFCFDFIANFYPRSVVASRIYLAAGRIAPFLDAMGGALQKFRRRGGVGPPPHNA